MLSTRRSAGLTLVEIVAFLVVVSVGAWALLPMLRNVMPRDADANDIIRATHLAQSRMELILGQRDAAGFPPADPCAGGTPPAICTPPAGLAVAVNLAQPWQAFPLTQYRRITVTVSSTALGATLAQIDAVAGSY